MMTGSRRQRGMTLIEVMIAMTVGLMLMASVGKVFLSSRQSYRLQEAQSRLQENARFAIELLTRTVRESGFSGCSNSVTPTSNLNSSTTYAFDFSRTIEGFEWTAGTSTSSAFTNWTPTLESTLTNAAPGSDVLTVRGPTGNGVNVTAIGTATTLPVGSNSLQQCEWVLVSNCENAVYAQTTNAAGSTSLAFGSGTCSRGAVTINPGNSATPTLTNFNFGSMVTPVATTTFYVREASTSPPAPQPKEYSLWRKIGDSAPEELVEGIENIQVLYGVDTVNDETISAPELATSRYVKADEVNNLLTTYPNLASPTVTGATAVTNPWTRVTSVRISLLARSTPMRDTVSGQSDTSSVSSDPQIYRFDLNSDGTAEPITATDRRLRRVFTTTLSLRNRLR